MNTALLALLACPVCHASLALSREGMAEGSVEAGELRCAGCAAVYPIVRSIPRFVSSDNYAASFGFQWTRFSRTQLDSVNGTSISRDRFLKQSGWTPEMLEGRRVLDAGAGSGRFTEVALSLGAQVVALDYSSAIDAMAGTFANRDGLHLVQGDLLALPFKDGAFDLVYCFGVLQHTADARGAVRNLAAVMRRGGRLAVDIYSAGPAHWSHPRFWLRPLTRRLAPATLFRAVERTVPVLLPLSTALGRVPVAGRVLSRLVPVANYEGRLPLSPARLREWAVLDTFDWLSPRYDRPQSRRTLERWLHEAGLRRVEVSQPVMLTGRGERP